MLMSAYDAERVIKAHLAGDNAILISTEQYLDLPAVQQVIANYKAEQASMRAEWRQIEHEAVLNARKDGNIALTDSQRVIQLYRETDLSISAIAQRLKLKVAFVKGVISAYGAQ